MGFFSSSEQFEVFPRPLVLMTSQSKSRVFGGVGPGVGSTG